MPDIVTDAGLDLVPLYVVLSGLVWVIHDYFITLEDEVTYFWSKKWNFGTLIFLWIRYYTIFLVIFDSIQIHIFPTPTIMTRSLIVGAISLWTIEIIMQIRVYILFKRSKRVATVNGVLFAISVGIFLWIVLDNGLHHHSLPSGGPPSGAPPPGAPPPGSPPPGPPPPGLPPPGFAPGPPPPGPPPNGSFSGPPPRPKDGCVMSANDGRWAPWLPATIFEFVLFGLAVYKTIVSSSAKNKLNGRRSLTAILLHENIVYFFAVACVLVLNNLMAVCATHVPWLGYGPFHAALGIATCRMLIHLRAFASENLEAETGSRCLPDLGPPLEPTA
ncbi:hypothetical protein M413DRAFT_266236 [Hebeloma cylindrosporum]|uniref:DUF6533 domain-containing protein n=1 Tax=Hebeloma cylindrosporum TaxID=76867 RepID=A0A0C2YAS0_HEBCY|nr:hypothetical protein M413DRAFT_266236 [Hebeloma cylindrosporum h7]